MHRSNEIEEMDGRKRLYHYRLLVKRVTTRPKPSLFSCKVSEPLTRYEKRCEPSLWTNFTKNRTFWIKATIIKDVDKNIH